MSAKSSSDEAICAAFERAISAAYAATLRTLERENIVTVDQEALLRSTVNICSGLLAFVLTMAPSPYNAQAMAMYIADATQARLDFQYGQGIPCDKAMP